LCWKEKYILYERKQILLHMEKIGDIKRLLVETKRLLWT